MFFFQRKQKKEVSSDEQDDSDDGGRSSRGARQQQQQQQGHRQPIKTAQHQQQRRAAGSGYTPPPPQHQAAASGRPAPGRTSTATAPAAAPRARATPHLTPDAAATRIQTVWRGARLARQRPAVKRLAGAREQLRAVAAREHALLAGQAGQLTQKQYLELSEMCMKVLFDLDATSTGGAHELRAKRKELTKAANLVLDRLQAEHKAAP